MFNDSVIILFCLTSTYEAQILQVYAVGDVYECILKGFKVCGCYIISSN
jgi:hypothetical protein